MLSTLSQPESDKTCGFFYDASIEYSLSPWPCRNVILRRSPKDLVFVSGRKREILRLRLRMTFVRFSHCDTVSCGRGLA
jgi:hypothetical protein